MEELLEAARSVQSQAYVPYSEYRVGAGLRGVDGRIYTGCNIENVNFSNSLHAEEAAIATAVTAGCREFAAIAVSSDRRDGVTPCGMCRQTLAEFCGDEFPVFCDHGESTSKYTLGELLPATMSGEMLDGDADAE